MFNPSKLVKVNFVVVGGEGVGWEFSLSLLSYDLIFVTKIHTNKITCVCVYDFVRPMEMCAKKYTT